MYAVNQNNQDSLKSTMILHDDVSLTKCFSDMPSFGSIESKTIVYLTSFDNYNDFFKNPVWT